MLIERTNLTFYDTIINETFAKYPFLPNYFVRPQYHLQELRGKLKS